LSNPQLAEIEASLQAIVRRAYDLGRSDAFKKVVDAVNCDQLSEQEPLALMAPDQTSPAPQPAPEAHAETAEPNPPWWARPLGRG